jgi:orotidine-5'-phosphate decarboxylase
LTYKNAEQLMFVIGATQPESFKSVREIVPNHFLLVPGVGAQGGSLEAVCQYGLNADVGLLINSSRDIIFAGNDANFAQKASEKALEIQQKMEILMAHL